MLSDRLEQDGDSTITARQLQTFLEVTTDGTLLTDASQKIAAWNQNFLDLWNLTNEPIVSGDLKKILELIAQKLKDSRLYLARIAQIGASWEKSFDLLELSDRRVIEQYTKAIVVQGAIVGRVWTFRNVTEQRQSDLVLRRFEAIVDDTEDAIIERDLNGIITTWNRAAERLFGYSAAEMIGASVMKLIPRERQDEEEKILTRVRRGERFRDFETIRNTKDGRHFTYL